MRLGVWQIDKEWFLGLDLPFHKADSTIRQIAIDQAGPVAVAGAVTVFVLLSSNDSSEDDPVDFKN